MTEPVYWRIAQEFRHAIESGYWRPGDKLLTESELKDEYRTSRNTVCDAKKWLTHRAWSRPGPARAPLWSSTRASCRTGYASSPEGGQGGRVVI